MDIISWLIAGTLALLAFGATGYGLINDVIVGYAGALIGVFSGKFIGMWLFGLLGMPCPFGGPLGSIVTTFLGFVSGVLLLAGVRLLRTRTYGGTGA